MFVTVWMGILELSSGRLICSNAGHEYPIIRGEDGVFHILKDKHGLVLGGMSGSIYKNYEITLHKGDAVFVYTDGVPEAGNSEGEFYGIERLEAALNKEAQADPQKLLENVRRDVDQFVKDELQFDDLTMLCLEYKGNSRF